MLALLDADILVYKIGFTTMEEPEGIALYRLDEYIGEILTAIDIRDYKCFLTPTDKSNYRFDLFPE